MNITNEINLTLDDQTIEGLSPVQVQKLKELEEMIQYYGSDPSRRAVENGRCKYRTVDGKKCAVGRRIPDEKYSDEIEGKSIDGFSCSTLFAKVAKLSSLGIVFWSNLQTVHDDPDYFNKDTFSREGVKRIVELRDSIVRGNV